ncbi:hypothetical protein [Streptomyces sp. I05A-00742]|uniref:hypothetical protein n=1 Tax=Streptomyces sp. I05A-00742 TaxID=2732853 RepID=UPI001488EA67|nr:hypothetical protein [Streptomyces sp. I05A-00742]
MSDTTPSQAEGERDDEPPERVHPQTPRTTPSQAEGERDENDENKKDPEPKGR